VVISLIIQDGFFPFLSYQGFLLASKSVFLMLARGKLLTVVFVQHCVEAQIITDLLPHNIISSVYSPHQSSSTPLALSNSTLTNLLCGASHAEAANYPFCTIDPNVVQGKCCYLNPQWLKTSLIREGCLCTRTTSLHLISVSHHVMHSHTSIHFYSLSVLGAVAPYYASRLNLQ
jgi:hypothetical protein